MQIRFATARKKKNISEALRKTQTKSGTLRKKRTTKHKDKFANTVFLADQKGGFTTMGKRKKKHQRNRKKNSENMFIITIILRLLHGCCRQPASSFFAGLPLHLLLLPQFLMTLFTNIVHLSSKISLKMIIRASSFFLRLLPCTFLHKLSVFQNCHYRNVLQFERQVKAITQSQLVT
jgi:anaerobic C4-dicarboxylate transporter